MTEQELLQLYNLESYLFKSVRTKFKQNHILDAFDFFCIIIWKANRAKSKIAHKLIKKYPNLNNLNEIVNEFTQSIYNASLSIPNDNGRASMEFFFQQGFYTPMSSAILSVLFPKTFTVYDIRVCDQLNNFHFIDNKTHFQDRWDLYTQYRTAVNQLHQGYSLRDKDRIIWGQSFESQLHKDINDRFIKGGLGAS